MPTEPNQARMLIEEFFEAVQLRRLKRCQALLDSLGTLAHEQPSFEPWCLYLQGILTFESQNDWAAAEHIFAQLLQTSLEPDLHQRVLQALGRTLEVQGRWQEAITVFKQIVALGSPLEKAKAWKHIALTFYFGFTQGDFGPDVLRQALENCQSALEVLQPIMNSSPDVTWLEGSLWNTLGLVYLCLAQWDEAISCYEKDLAICHTLEDRHGMGLTYGNLGEVYQKRGRDNWPAALAAYQQALNLIREFDNRYDETEALANLAFLHQEMGQFEIALDYYSQALQLIEDLRTNISSEAARAGYFATIADIYAHTILLCLQTGRLAEAFNHTERARSRAFLDILAAGSPNLSRQMEASTLTLSEVQNILPPDAVLLEYFTTGLEEVRLNPKVGQQGVQRPRFPPARSLLFAVTRDRLEVHDLYLSPNDLRPSQLHSVVEQHFLQPQIRRMLYNKLISPIETLLQDKHYLYLVPHGPLHYIPFQALLAPDGDTLLREKGPQLTYAPNAALLFRDRVEKQTGVPNTCLAIGYNSRGETQLDFSEKEAVTIAQITEGQALVGERPKKAVLYEQAINYRFLHLACHGKFKSESPLESFLHLAPEEKLTALDTFNHLRLDCDLVTLSACESGLSLVRRGDELMGFMRAFMYAGAQNLISTLWRVEDYVAQILMKKFYQEVQTGQDFAEALKQAQLYVKNYQESNGAKPFEDPIYWAAFILFGHCRPAAK